MQKMEGKKEELGKMLSRTYSTAGVCMSLVKMIIPYVPVLGDMAFVCDLVASKNIDLVNIVKQNIVRHALTTFLAAGVSYIDPARASIYREIVIGSTGFALMQVWMFRRLTGSGLTEALATKS